MHLGPLRLQDLTRYMVSSHANLSCDLPSNHHRFAPFYLRYTTRYFMSYVPAPEPVELLSDFRPTTRKGKPIKRDCYMSRSGQTQDIPAGWMMQFKPDSGHLPVHGKYYSLDEIVRCRLDPPEVYESGLKLERLITSE